jgi:hypothetical protein
MTRQGTTAQDHRNLGQAVGRTIVLRYNWKQALVYIRTETCIPITVQGYYKVVFEG